MSAWDAGVSMHLCAGTGLMKKPHAWASSPPHQKGLPVPGQKVARLRLSRAGTGEAQAPSPSVWEGGGAELVDGQHRAGRLGTHWV